MTTWFCLREGGISYCYSRNTESHALQLSCCLFVRTMGTSKQRPLMSWRTLFRLKPSPPDHSASLTLVMWAWYDPYASFILSPSYRTISTTALNIFNFSNPRSDNLLTPPGASAPHWTRFLRLSSNSYDFAHCKKFDTMFFFSLELRHNKVKWRRVLQPPDPSSPAESRYGGVEKAGLLKLHSRVDTAVHRLSGSAASTKTKWFWATPPNIYHTNLIKTRSDSEQVRRKTLI